MSKTKNNMVIPKIGNFPIFTKGNLKISNGYESRKNLFFEILPKQIVMDNIEIPFHQRWREFSEKSNYIEYRSKDYNKIKIIFDKNKKRFYVSIKDLISKKYPFFTRKSF